MHNIIEVFQPLKNRISKLKDLSNAIYSFK